MPVIAAPGGRIEYERIGGAEAHPFVMLHEGMDSVSMWKDFPEQVAQAMGSAVFVYSRLGYGRSVPCRHTVA